MPFYNPDLFLIEMCFLQYDSHTWTADLTGEYRACFSNEFSTFSHKLVYVDFQVGDEEPLPGVGEHLTAMTQVWSAKSAAKRESKLNHFETLCHVKKCSC